MFTANLSFSCFSFFRAFRYSSAHERENPVGVEWENGEAGGVNVLDIKMATRITMMR